jgi:hypothetical protein
VSSPAERPPQLILTHAVKEFTRTLAERLQAMYASHSAQGRLQSGSTIIAAVRTMEELALDTLERASAQVRNVATGRAAYDLLCVAVEDILEFARDKLPEVVRMATGGMSAGRNSSASAAADSLLNEFESNVEAKLEIAAYDFEQADPAQDDLAGAKSQKAGRPRAAFWDDMWASIAFDLYEGNLKPRTQAELESAMLEWIEAHGFTAATSTVRARARRLWDLIQNAE